MTYTFHVDGEPKPVQINAISLAGAWRRFWGQHPEERRYVRCYNESGWVAGSTAYPNPNPEAPCSTT